jgi:hypothetical protein
MKKVLFSTVALLAFGFANAQEETPVFKSKKGENYLPVAGDWALGFDATKFVEFAGKSVGGNASSPTVEGVNETALYAFGKYFKTDKLAYRVLANLTYLNNSKTEYNQLSMIAGLGKEWRRGSTRLQGFYGMDALMHFDSGAKIGDGDREKSTFGIGARGFIGCEYFVLPKISIGLEYGYSAMLQSKDSKTFINLGGVDTGLSTSPQNNPNQVDSDNGGNANSNNWGSGHLNITFHF